jgi:hypothetical protein
MAYHQSVDLRERYPLAHQAYVEAQKLAVSGEEFAHLISLMIPEYSMRLRVFVQHLPEPVRMKTIYGRAVSREIPVKKKR